MRVLLIKLSSLGDVIHTLPALTDACNAIPGIEFNWVIEEAFAEIPGWHPGVARILPLALRRWRRHWIQSREERQLFRANISEQAFDRIIDAQGLLKSALVARQAIGPRWGFDRQSVREPLATLNYAHKVSASWELHAVTRTRTLFSAALGYPNPTTSVDYGVQQDKLPSPLLQEGDIVFLHGTTWASKHWPESYWMELMSLAAGEGLHVLLPWGSTVEHERAVRIADAGRGYGHILPRASLGQLASQIAAARLVIGVDTGLAHLAAALGVPSVTLYGATRADYTGTRGGDQIHLSADFPCSPCLKRECRYRGPSTVSPACYEQLAPGLVWQQVLGILTRHEKGGSCVT